MAIIPTSASSGLVPNFNPILPPFASFILLIDEVFKKVDKLADANSHRERNGLKLIDSGHFRWDIRQLKINTKNKLQKIMDLLEEYGDDAKLVTHEPEEKE